MLRQNQFIDYTVNLKRAVVNQRALIYWLLVIIIGLAITIAYLATHHAEFLVPYGLNKKTAIAINRITPTYISSIGLSDAAIYFNIDRTNVDEQNALFLSRVASNVFGSLELKLKQRANYFHSNDIAQQFYPYERYTKNNNTQIVIKGKLIRWLSGKLLSQRLIVLNISYSNLNGHLYINQWRYHDE